MKKKEWIALIIIAVLSVSAIVLQRFIKRNTDTEVEIPPYATVAHPQGDPIGEWITVVHRNRIILYFDSGVDDFYEVEGNVGHMTIEVKDNMWHVHDVDCYDYTCKNMGWMSSDSLLPIICLPNDLVIIDEATALNMVSEGAQ